MKYRAECLADAYVLSELEMETDASGRYGDRVALAEMTADFRRKWGVGYYSVVRAVGRTSLARAANGGL